MGGHHPLRHRDLPDPEQDQQVVLMNDNIMNFVSIILIVASVVGPILAIKWFLFGGKKK